MEVLGNNNIQPGELVGPPALQVRAVAPVACGAEADVRALLALRLWLGPASRLAVKPASPTPGFLDTSQTASARALMFERFNAEEYSCSRPICLKG